MRSKRAVVKYVKVDNSGRLIFRRVYPEPLRPFIPGSHELIRTLKAKDITEPGALDRYQQALADYDHTVTKARKVASGQFDVLDQPTIAYLAEAFRVEQIAQDDAGRWDEAGEREVYATIQEKLPADAISPFEGRVADRWAEKRREVIEGVLPHYRALHAKGDLDGIVDEWSAEAADLAEVNGYTFKTDTPEFKRLCAALNAAAISACELSLQRLDGHIIPTPAEPIAPVPDSVQKLPAKSRGETFDAIAQGILDNPRHAIGHSTKESSRTALRFFREAHGTPTPAKITKGMVTEFLDLLSKRPAKLPKAERGVPLRELVARYEDMLDVERLSQKTWEQHLGSLAALWNKAQGEHDAIPDGLPNPFKRKLPPKQKAEVPQLSLEDLNAVFALPIFTIGERPGGGKGEASYWMPLMLLWTGARPEEIAQLLVEDIFKHPESGRWVLRITDEGVHPHKGQRLLKTSKTGTGRRTFPMPQALLDLGFLHYVDQLKKAGETALFPKLRTKGKRKLLFAGFGDWWGGYLREHGVVEAGDGLRPARAFRHAWTTAARKCKIPRDAREYIQGHRAAGASANEVYGEQEALGEWIDQLAYNGLDMSGVIPWVPTH